VIRKMLSLTVVMASLALAACGGGGGNTITSPPSDGGGGGGTPPPTGPTVATVQLLASSTQLPSDKTGINKVSLTALVRDSSNVVLEGIPVVFSADSGALTVTQNTTDESGAALAELTNGLNPQNRIITVSAQAQNVTAQIQINVTGTTLTVTGPGALALGDSASYTAVLRDANNAGIDGQTVNLDSQNGNTLSVASMVTGASGEVQFSLTAVNGGNDTLTATALGLTSTRAISVSSDSFVFTAPASLAEIPIGDLVPVSVQWTKSGVPQAGQMITFTSTRGTLSAGSAITDGSGLASVNVSSTSAGPAVLTATNPEGTSTTRSVEFVATEAASLILQASPFTLATGQQSTLTATVRDGNGNLVKNKVVEFVLTDVTGGFLSLASDITDSQGRAQTFYTAGQTASQPDGVSITARVQENPLVADTVTLTVAQEALNISLGTGNDLFELGTATFAKEWVVIVTDSVGNAVANKEVQVSLTSLDYYKGGLIIPEGSNAWVRPAVAPGTNLLPGEFDLVDPVTLRCANEDPANTGLLDPASDFNGNGRIEPGNIAAVAAVPADAPLNNPCASAGSQGTAAQVTTNSQGLARVCVIYPQNYNLWLDVKIEAKASVTGTEFARSQAFLLPALASDLSNTNASPPGVVSPFGEVTEQGCSEPPPGT
jgi:hypothetical protein